ncbi:hypothetical protein IW261DRAFT_816075 [Armillaria novae-zelandiae]|uniref:Secreted protein n=1 Tax=Armillaria novae-zelandiae TaxID=153914 RepID=A0AA39UB59_9AGAR|nr:hypothetical protein IW261DRAFT_816075 [Armillaria novae-zelandiae]
MHWRIRLCCLIRVLYPEPVCACDNEDYSFGIYRLPMNWKIFGSANIVSLWSQMLPWLNLFVELSSNFLGRLRTGSDVLTNN